VRVGALPSSDGGGARKAVDEGVKFCHLKKFYWFLFLSKLKRTNSIIL